MFDTIDVFTRGDFDEKTFNCNNEDERSNNIPLGYPLPKEDCFGHVPSHQNHCLPVVEEQLNPTDHVMAKI